MIGKPQGEGLEDTERDGPSIMRPAGAWDNIRVLIPTARFAVGIAEFFNCTLFPDLGPRNSPSDETRARRDELRAEA